MLNNTAKPHTETTGEAWAKALLPENNTSIENEIMKQDIDNNASARAETATELLSITNDSANNLSAAQPQAADKVTEKHGQGLHSHIYKKVRLDMLKKKCPSVRSFCDGGTALHMDDLYASNMTRLLVPFEGGVEFAENACSKLPNFDQAAFDADVLAGRSPGQPELTCAQIKLSACASCPVGGCTLPTGEIAISPTELLVWGEVDLKGVAHQVMADSIMQSEFSDKLFSVGDSLYIYGEGIFSILNLHALSRIALSHLDSHAKETHAKAIARMVFIKCKRSVDVLNPDPNFICFNNGTLNVKTKQLEPHSPVHMLINRIPHNYDSEAKCPRFMQFLDEIWVDDQDRDQKIQFIRQFMGYLLVADSSMQKMLILKGEGANGKSVLLETIKGIVGEPNTTNVMISHLSKSYVRASLEGMLLNVSADLPKKGIVADGELKAMVAGDSVEAAAKYKDSKTFTPYNRFVVATNNLPDCKDTSEGYFRRLIILEFKHKFAPDQRDPMLATTLMSESEGIIAWCLGGLYELRDQGRFTIPPSSDRAVEIYEEEIFPLKTFAKECLMPSENGQEISSSELFTVFFEWAKKRKLDAGSVVTMGRDLVKLDLFESRKSNETQWSVKPKSTAEAKKYFRKAKFTKTARARPNVLPLLKMVA